LNIRYCKQFLYVEINLDSKNVFSPKREYSFKELIIYGSFKKPLYGHEYKDNSSDEDVNEDVKIGDVFNIYTIKFEAFSSYLETYIIKDPTLK
jgi:hypothetical protein